MAMPPAFGDVDYQQAMLNLLPRGRVWRRDALSVLSQVLGALAPTYMRSTAAAAQVLLDGSPETTTNLLPEWEASLGLPDACTPASPTFSQRQAAVRQKWAARGGQSQAYFISLAAQLGYTITVTLFAPSRFGNGFGSPFGGLAWAHTWQVNMPTELTQPLAFGTPFGQPFGAAQSTELQCRILKAAPAQTAVLFRES